MCHTAGVRQLVVVLMYCVLFVLGGLGTVGCIASPPSDPEDPASTESQPIIGGQVSLGDPAVVMLLTPDGACTGSLISPHVILTAAHCLKNSADAGSQTSGRVFFGSSVGNFSDEIRSRRLLPGRYYTTGLQAGSDIAVVRLRDPAPSGIEPLPYNTRPLDATDVGKIVRAVGFGVTNGQTQTGSGTKRTVDLSIRRIEGEFIVVGDNTVNTCQGDSGGPILLTMDGVPTIIGVTAFGAQGCLGDAYKTRVDEYAADFLDIALSSWDGPCAQDGNCNSSCSDIPDPDCDICGLDGFCGSGCAAVDLDCPVVGFVGDSCSSNDDCESRRCIVAPDDDRISFCSQECSSNLDCSLPIPVCEQQSCAFAGPTPGATGSSCSDSTDCVSDLCHPLESVCSQACTESSDCSEGQTCSTINGTRMCEQSSDSGCGSIDGGSSIPVWFVIVSLACWYSRRRRTNNIAR